MKKKWYMSKTMWAAGVTFVLAMVDAMGYPIPKELYVALGSLGLYGVRDAMK